MPTNTKKTTKKRGLPVWTALGIAAAVALAVGIGVWLSSGQTDEAVESSKLYFVNTVTNQWETESRPLTASAKRTELVSEVLNMLVAGPRSATLTGSVPSPTLILGGTLVEGTKADAYGVERDNVTVAVTFSEEYNDLDGVASARCLHSIVYSLTELAFVDDVYFYIGETELMSLNGQPVGALNRGNMLLGNAPVVPDPVNEQEVIVYFSDDQALELVAEKRSVEVSLNKPMEQYIVEELLKGPASDALFKTIASDTKLHSAYTVGDICYVDFSADFVNKFTGGTAAERLMIYSIVNSLTELPNVKKVKFLIDNDNILDSKGLSYDLSKPFERDADVIAR